MGADKFMICSYHGIPEKMGIDKRIATAAEGWVAAVASI